MIRVVIGRRDSYINMFRVSGHAEYDDYGKDIICSAMSMLAINTVNSLQFIADETFDIEQDEDEGLISAAFDHKPNEKAEVLLAAFELGVQGVIDQYGNEFVSLVYETSE
ncbi:MAG: ribosomal-processing cysteine protease Prp [Eubacterium sp.]|nr:ribosomal-processing cysteine protease Prp [Eubacterium sp.]